jgi:hypothetical protein
MGNGGQPPPKTERLLSEARHHEGITNSRSAHFLMSVWKTGRNFVPFSPVQKPKWFVFPSARFRGDDPDLEMQPGRTMPHVLCRAIYLWHGSLLRRRSISSGLLFLETQWHKYFNQSTVKGPQLLVSNKKIVH